MNQPDRDAEGRDARLLADLRRLLAKGIGRVDLATVPDLVQLWAPSIRRADAQRAAIRKALLAILDPDHDTRPESRDRLDLGLAGQIMFGTLAKVTFPASGQYKRVEVDSANTPLLEDRLMALALVRNESFDATQRIKGRGATPSPRQQVFARLRQALNLPPDEAAATPPPRAAAASAMPSPRASDDASALQLDITTGGASGPLAALAYRLGIRRSPAAPAFAVPPDQSTDRVRLSHYVTRAAVDAQLCAAIGRTFASGVHVVAVEGASYTGKSRALLRALLSQRRMFRLLAPRTPDELVAVLTESASQPRLHTDRPTMVWLDPLEPFTQPAGGVRWDDLLAQHATRRAPIVLLAGLGGTAALPAEPETREFLQLEHPLDQLRDLNLAEVLTLEEISLDERGFDDAAALDEIRQTYDAASQTRPGAWETAARDGGFLRALAHGGLLERRYRNGWPDPASLDPRGQAVAWAVMAWRRAVQCDDPMGADVIEGLARHSPMGSRGHIGSESELDAALAWACRRAPENASSLISPVRHTGGVRAFRAEAFLAQALVPPRDLTAEVWALIEGAAPASRLAIVRDGGNMSRVQAHGRPSETAAAVDIDARGRIATRGSIDDDPHRERDVVSSVAFRTTSGFEGRLREVDTMVEVTLWATPVAAATSGTVVLRLAPVPRSPGAPRTALPVVVIAKSDDGYWESRTDVVAPRSEADWRALTESVRVATMAP
jgi:hypothetical protein